MQKLLIFALFFGFSLSAYISKTITTSDEFIFLGRFCFDGIKNENGTLNLTIQTQTTGLVLSMYYDQYWYPAWKGSGCLERLANARSNTTIRTPMHYENFIFEEGTPHFWYVAVANCEGKEITLTYTENFLQGEPGWNQKLSHDMSGFQSLYLTFFIFFFVVLVVHVIGDVQLYRANALHPIVRMLTLAVGLEFFSVFLNMIHYAVLAQNGVGLNGARIVGELCDFVAILTLMLLVILIAKGFAVNHPTLSHFQDEKFVFLGILGGFLVFYFSFYFWSLFGFNPASHIYVMEAPSGALVLTVRFLIALYFGFCIFRTYQSEADSFKRRFFLVFGICFMIYFLIVPLVVLFELADPDIWRRWKVSLSFYLLAQFFALTGLTFLTWPSQASKYFQVGAPDSLLAPTSQTGYDTL